MENNSYSPDSKDRGKIKRFFVEFWRVFRYFALFVGMQIWAVIVLAIIAEILDAVTGGNSSEFVAGENGAIICLIMSTIVTSLLLRYFLGNEWKITRFWRYEKKSYSPLLLCVFLGIVASITVNAFLASLVTLTEEPVLVYTTGNPAMALITYGLIIPVIEETVVRGTVLKRLKEINFNTRWAIIIQATVFAILHLDSGIQIFYSFFLGIILGLAYLWFNSIWLPIAMHIAFNSFSYFFALFFSTQGKTISSGIWALSGLIGVALIVVFMKILKQRRTE